jgi:hypothetical protein
MGKALLAVALMAGSLGAADGEPATVTGTVKIQGRPLKGTPANPPPDCAAHFPGGCRLDDIVVDGENHVRWAFVYVKKGLEGKTFAVPREPVVLDQKGCRYDPHVFGLQAGQPLLVKNSDGVLHNVHGLPLINKEFNYGQVPGAQNTVTLNRDEMMVRIKCDIHSIMGAWAGVLPHPFFAATDAAGKYTIKGLPPGKYTIEVWHEKYKAVAQEVEVKAGEVKTADFALADKKE